MARGLSGTLLLPLAFCGLLVPGPPLPGILRRVLSILRPRPQLQLSPVKLSELHADLKMQEREEFAWKKLKAEGRDEDGEKQAKLVHSLSGIFLSFPCGGLCRTRGRATSSEEPPWAVGAAAGPFGEALGEL